MYKVLKRTCWAIVLPIRSIVFPRSRCRRRRRHRRRRRRGLLKVPIVKVESDIKEVYDFLVGLDCFFKAMPLKNSAEIFLNYLCFSG